MLSVVLFHPACGEGQVLMNFSSFCLSGNFFSFSCLEDTFARYTSLGEAFSPLAFACICHRALPSVLVSGEKYTVIISIIFSCYKPFYLSVFEISVSRKFDCDMSLWESDLLLEF